MKISLSGFGLCLSVFLFIFSFSNAQVSVDKKINMTGVLNDDRRIINVGDVVANADAVNAQILQKGILTYASTVSGTGDNVIVNTIPSFTPVAGTEIAFKAIAANTGVPFLNVNGAGYYLITKPNNYGLYPGELKSGQMVTAIYNGSYWVMTSPTAVAATEFTGFTSSSQSGTVIINHGITGTILSVTLTIEYLPGNFVWGEYSLNSGYKASIYWSNTQLFLANSAAPGSANILNKPYRIVVTWR